MTASNKTAPVTMKRTEESRHSRLRPELIDWLTRMLSTGDGHHRPTPSRLSDRDVVVQTHSEPLGHGALAASPGKAQAPAPAGRASPPNLGHVTVASTLADLISPLTGGTLPVHLIAWDGSSAGPVDAPVLHVRSADALRRLLWHPGELGAAQAYVVGDIDVDGDLGEALREVRQRLSDAGVRAMRPSPAVLAKGAKVTREFGILGRPLPPPKTQAQLGGRLHSLLRDSSAISFHYDLSNDFYEAILDDQMAYSSAYVTDPAVDLFAGTESPAYTLEDGQRDKLDLICRKVGLDERPGMRLVDIGCGWGSFTLHAAREFGARVVAVTISREQQAFVQARAKEQKVDGLVDVRLQDYREIKDKPFDAVVSIEMGEHVGDVNYPTYARTLRRLAAPGARVLIQAMSRPGTNPGGGPSLSPSSLQT